MGDTILISDILNGGRSKEKAISFLMEKNIHLIDVQVRKLGIGKDMALDAYSDAILAFVDQIQDGKFKGKSKLNTYLYKIFYFKCIDLLRKNTTKISEERFDVEVKAVSELNSNLEYRDLFDQLGIYFTKVGELCQNVLMDWGYWGYSMEEVAHRNNLKDAKQAKDKKYRCLQKLRALIPKEYEL